MRKMNVLVLLLVASSPCFCQEKMRVDIDGAATRTVPEARTGKGMIGDNTHRKIWRVDLSPSATSSLGSTMLEIRIANVSDVTRSLPLSQDGVKVVAECPGHTVLEGALFLGSKADNKYFRQVGLFYGCETFPTTLVRLKPGEWVTFVKNIPTDRLPKEIRAQISFVHKRYQPSPEGQSAEDQEYSTFEFSPWVDLPEAPGAGK
jgi:hypothetical protein